MAGRTIDGYRRSMWPMARIRLRDIRATKWGGTSRTVWPNLAGATIGAIFTSEKAMAMVLRWHIRSPGHMVSGGHAGRRLRNALNRAQIIAPRLTWTGNPNTWTDAHEQALVQGLLAEVATRDANLRDTVTQVSQWPTWNINNPRTNPRGYTLRTPIGPLSAARNSFNLDASNLP